LRFVRADDLEDFLADPWLHQLTMPDSRIITQMISHYLDTADRLMTQRKISLRVREEDDRRILTVKSDGQSKNGLHQRPEWSLALEDDWSDFLQAGLDTEWFYRHAVSQGDSDDQLHEILTGLDGQPLVEIGRIRFTRTAFDVGYGDTLMELALDQGEIIVGRITEPINELELELREGDVRDLMALGEELTGKFALVPETMSKFARCLSLMVGQENQ
jgi:triphosphatase